MGDAQFGDCVLDHVHRGVIDKLGTGAGGLTLDVVAGCPWVTTDRRPELQVRQVDVNPK